MLTLPRSRHLWGFGLLLLVPALALGPGCSSRPENSPVVRKKFQELASVQDQVADLAVQMKQMTAEMAAMRKDVADVSSLNGGGEAVARIEQIDTRMQSLEQEISKLGEAINAGAKIRQVASATDESTAPPSSESTRSSHTASSEPTRTRITSASASALPVRQVNHVSAPKPRGKYYTIKSGDTPSSIARAHNINVDTLLRANRLPREATVFPGQKLYVPTAN